MKRDIFHGSISFDETVPMRYHMPNILPMGGSGKCVLFCRQAGRHCVYFIKYDICIVFIFDRKSTSSLKVHPELTLSNLTVEVYTVGELKDWTKRLFME